jgi:RNA polymerase sigma factor (sigma-70 family)
MTTKGDRDDSGARRDASTHEHSGVRQVSRAPKAEDAAFAALYRRTFGLVWSMLGRHGIRRTEERHEVAQEVYEIAYRKRDKRPPEVSESAWIGAITWRVAYDHRRLSRNQREQPVEDPDNDVTAGVIAPGAGPEAIVALREHYLLLVEGLAPDRRIVFDLCEIDEHTLDEVALVLGIPKSTVNTRLRQAREEVAAAHKRLAAREAWQEGRATAMPALLPFGAGAWRSVQQVFDDAPAGSAEHVWRRLGESLGLSAAAGAGAGAAASAAAAPTGVALSGKVAAALVGTGIVLGAAGVEAFHMSREKPAPPAMRIALAPEVAPVAVAVTASASPGPSEPAPDKVAAALANATAAPTGTARPGAGSIDPEEQYLLDRATAAIAREQYDEARRALDEHARRFPKGGLRNERENRRAQIAAAQAKASPSAGPDAGRAPHRLLGTDD